MRSGKLRHRIAIETPTRTPDAGKGYSTSWATMSGGDVWAEITPLSSSDRFAQAHVYNGTTHTVTIRKLTGVDSTKRVKFGSRYFSINGVTNKDERGIEMQLSCEELKVTNQSA